MDSGQRIMAIEAGNLARIFPLPLMQLLAESVGRCTLDDWHASKGRVVQGIAHPLYRSLVHSFFDVWESHASEVTPQAVALSLLTATYGEKTSREHQSVELVWTGPDPEPYPFRHTEQAILQVLDSAHERITLVSYAIYRIPRICHSLVRAAGRGVRINVVAETPDRIQGEGEYNTLKALGPEVAACSRMYYWPRVERPHDDAGKLGILHVKCAVADGHWLFLSSANLTDYAFTINMELGVLIQGSDLPARVEQHFDQLVQKRILVPV